VLQHAIPWSYVPLAGILLLVFIAGIVRPLLQYMRHGSFGVHVFRSGHNIRDALFLLMFAGYLAHGISGHRRPRLIRLLVAEDGPWHSLMQPAGAALMGAGILLMAAAQLNMGASWRIGIDEETKPGIVSSGLYRFSRHPIYLGLLTALAGYTVMMPTPVSLLLFAGAYWGLRTQTGIEEDYMLRTYGQPYRQYASRVGRFVPGVGKL
jgi:protein-S-isoprenylcysteine O-methyltransferase Ste14